MSAICGLCGRALIGHGTVCLMPDEMNTTWTDNTKDTFEEARIRRIVREELERQERTFLTKDQA